QLQKTLRFELKPVGKTLEYIEEKGLINEDEKRAESYKEVKKIIDEYHKYFIDIALGYLKLEGMSDFFTLYFTQNKTDKEKKNFNIIQSRLRKQIAQSFSKNPNEHIKIRFKNLFAKELIKKDLLDWESLDDDRLSFVREFEKFTTYFTGFHENRKNMYSDEDKSTAIAYRLIHENLPKFLDNIKIYEDIRKKYPDLDFSTVNVDLEKILQGAHVDEVFKLKYFNETLTQTGIDFYNNLLGGITEEGQKKTKGLNEYINLYRQQNNLKKRDVPNFTPLYKQILSDRDSVSFLPDAFKEDQELVDSIRDFYLSEILDWQVDNKSHDLLEEIAKILIEFEHFDLSSIYIRNDRAITDISNNMFGQYSIIKDALNSYYSSTINPLAPNARVTKKYDEKKDKYISKSPYFSIQDIENALWLYKNEHDEIGELITEHSICDYFAKGGLKSNNNEESNSDLFKKIKIAYKNAETLLNTDYPENKNLSGDIVSKEKIKLFLDSIKDLMWFIKPLQIGTTVENKDVGFYNYYSGLFDQINLVTLLYDKTRNYLTKKPYSTEKFKLNFDNSHFLSGWAQDYETKGGLIFLKDNNYYLGIVDKKLTNIDKSNLNKKTENNPVSCIIYDFQKPDNKNIPRLFIRSKGDNFAPAVSKYELPVNEIIEIYDQGKFKTGYKKNNPDEFKKCLTRMIDYFKEGFQKHESYNHYNFQWKPSNQYIDISEFYKDAESSCYQLMFEKINYDELLELVDQGKIYLFQIYNKDFSPYSKGTPNLHTIYWKMLFDEENLKDVVYKLNGQAEVFFRKKSLNKNELLVHKANLTIKNKNIDNDKATSTFKYDIVKDRRYSVDKFQFHVPITLNFKAEGNNNLNEKVNGFLQNNSDTHIIGIDRGERHLLYVSVINQKGEIKEQFTLNQIVNEYKGRTYKTDYHKLLDKKEEERKQARVNWGTIENIKELKEGYLSQVVHKIAGLMVKYNAIVVMEDLNFGFKRGRIKVEKQIYQKFEKMLIDKLNYLVFKNEENPFEPGGKLKALQL
ncbi:MAG: type V CRISPR-associated protein Cas12a/Cpf1, partial [Calditrichales bacterium]|nr:type V CRISPR-associated protein Cas12a/Cpf1 [Calditrichales bacterium]